ncbi:MAG: hypothetical protein NT062_10910 [Proteobacteria bacterium]|nr:hypothetical protein [Pseudomonadota bacterium]
MRGGLIGAALVATLALVGPARAGDPTRSYRTVETDHFVIYYWTGYDDVAHRVGVVAERAHHVLSPALDHAPSGKTIIVLVDDTDSANGFAGVLPRNAIQLYLTGPSSFTELDDHEDWLYGLVAHEYTHILHLDTMSGLPTIYNRIYGKTWAPNQVMPRWVIEGIATYEESKRSAGGRNRGTRFDQVIRIAREDGHDLRLDEINGAPRQYPRGNAAYIYGSHFLRYVFDRFGDDTLRKMSHTAGAYPIPFAVNRQIAKVVGKPFTELYEDWGAYLRDRYGLQKMGLERRGLRPGTALTHTGESNQNAQYSADGRELYWVQNDGYTAVGPRIRAMPVSGTPAARAAATRDVAQIDAMGPFDVLTDGSLVYEQGRQFRREYSFQDLFRRDGKTGMTTRITTGKRARDPAVSPDERRVAFSMNEKSESVIAVTNLAPDAAISVVWHGQRYDQAYQPSWSPDGKRLAFSAWRNGGYRDILVVELATGQVEEITRDRAIDMFPTWSSDGRYLFFDSDRTGISNIYAFDERDRSLWQVTNVVGGAFRGRPSPDGTRLAFEAAVPKGGWDLHEIALDRAAWLPARDYFDDKPPPVVVRDDEAAVSAPRAYRALETLAPQSWTGTFQFGDTPSVAIQTGGADALGLHSYALSMSSPIDQGTLNLGGSYGYGGFRPNFRLAGARTIVTRTGKKLDGVNKLYAEEDWSGTLAASVPFESRPGQSWSLSFDYDVDYFRTVDQTPVPLDPNMRVPVTPPSNYTQAGIGTRVGFSNVKGVTYGIGGQTGFDASVSLRLDHPAFGARYHNITLSYAFDTYQRLWGKTPTLAVRLVGSFRAGDLTRGGSFGLGSVPSQDVVMSIVNSARSSATGYLRGYKSRAVSGNQYHLLNLEYRQELVAIERGLQTLPIYIRRLQLAGLSDVGTAFDGTFDFDRHFKMSVGGALRLDAYFGNYVPGTLEVGYARGLLGDGAMNETWFLLTGSL